MTHSLATEQLPTTAHALRWRVALDTGGTFTDVVGIDPNGTRHRVKVPSDGSLSATLNTCEITNAGINASFIPAAGLHFPDGFLDDWLLIGHAHTGKRVCAQIRSQRGRRLSLQPHESSDIGAFSLLAHGAALRCVPSSALGVIDAPRLGLHLITRTPLEAELPPIEIRLSTTRGTNALLEGNGARVGVLVSDGLSGVVTIADQTRSDLFARVPTPRKLLAHAVRTLRERTLADGTHALLASDEEIRIACEQLRHEGCDIVVVSLAHALTDNGRETRVAQFVRDLGFPAVAASSLAPHPRLQTRTETAVVAARIAPTLYAFVEDALRSAPRDARSFVFTSAGVLQAAHAFEPRDTLFSGPAGGAVAMQELARKHHVRRALGFDMGGTSSDVSRLADGVIAMRRESCVARATVATPALAIDSIAAGGGSICRVHDGACIVGPESAGSNPGPACYGRGGPLTISDINVLAGRLVCEVGLGNASLVLDRDAAERALASVVEESGIARDTLMESFLDIANARMALAMENLCVRDGVDPRGTSDGKCVDETSDKMRDETVGDLRATDAHTLFAFGGAGGQHACAIAARLGLNHIVFPHAAGFLCASGVLAAQPARIASQPVLKPLASSDRPLREAYEHARMDATHALMRDGFHLFEKSDVSESSTTLAYAALRLGGQEATIEVSYADPASMQREFHARFEELFGYPPPDRVLEVESVRVEVRAGNTRTSQATNETPSLHAPEHAVSPVLPPPPSSTVRMLSRGLWHDARVFERTSLTSGMRLDGPSIIIDAGESVVIDVGWSAVVTPSLDMIAEATTSQPHRSSTAESELFAARLEAIALGMGHILERTALSPNIRDRLDFSCAILDASGTLIQNAPHVPVHLGALGMCTRLVIENLAMQRLDLCEGDVAVTNHPAFGGSHLPDVTTIAPIFVEGRRVAFVAVRAHHAEIGGTRPGSFPPDARCLAEEGVVLAPFLAVERGSFQREACRARFSEAAFPSRNPEENLADLEAQLAATRHGVTEVRTLRQECGSAFDALCESELARADRAMQRAIARLRDVLHHPSATTSTLRGQAQLDDGSLICATIRVVAAQTPNTPRLHISFAGSSAQHPRSFNAPLAVTRAATLYALRLWIDEPIPMNEGLLRSVELEVPEGMLHPRCVEDPSECPPVVAGNVETSQSIVAALLDAFGFSAESQSTMNNTLFGNNTSTIYETLGGGAGAGPTSAGASCVHVHMSNTRLTDIDALERRAPVIIRRFETRQNSGGYGCQRGGDGLIRSYEFREPVSLSFFGSRRRFAPRGAYGGCDGLIGTQRVMRNGVETAIADGVFSLELQRGDVFTVETPGGGGWGTPRE
ncbi:MAG: hydantoinase B/oxoprolinase family protein [Limnohabitans sp.]|nr:hydantoinase B/oxoprolinase family protein [Limnohabitans sp.]